MSDAAVRVIAPGAVEAPLRDLAASFTRQTGREVEIIIGNAGQVATRVRAGEAFDLVCNAAEPMAALITEHLLDGATLTDLGSTRLGLGVRAGTSAPDISTPAALRATLLAARSVSLADARTGATSGKAILAAFDHLGIAAIIEPKLRPFVRGSLAAEAVADGQVDLVLTQISEIVTVPGVTLAGPLPDAVQLVTSYQAAISSAAETAGATSLLAVMLSTEGRTRFQSGGFTTT